MLRFLADENFNNDVLRGVLRRNPDLDVVRVQDVGLQGLDDPSILEWAANEGRVLLTHDVETMTNFAYERVVAEKKMPGVFEIKRSLPLREVIDDLLLLAECSGEGQWEGQVRYFPI